MKRLLLSALFMVTLAACASPLAKQETPQQALSAASQRSTQLKSAKFDLQGHVSMNFPPQLSQMLGQSGTGAGSLALDLSGNGEAQFPDRYHALITAKLAGLSVTTEVIVVGSQAYVKNPLSGKWEISTAAKGVASQLNEPDPLSYAQLRSNVKTITDLGDTTLDNTTVHHYHLTLDKDKLSASLTKSGAKNAQALAAIKQILDSGSLTVDVQFGKDDHLVREVATDADYTVDLASLMGALGAPASASSSALPAGASIHATAHVVVHYSDFDSPITISIPTVG
jgi:hypothetical protein